MLYEKYQNELKDILEALERCDFNELEEEYFDEKVVEIFKEKYSKYRFKVGTGATKGVLIFPDLGFVIKIPFQLCDGYELCGAEEGNEYWDYCSQESNRYNLAFENKVEQAFLQTKIIEYINNYPIYIQEIAEPLESIHDYSHSSSTEEDKNKVANIIDEHCFDYINTSWEADLYVYYGEEYYIKLKQFIEEYDITDLRSPNIGYIGKAPVIFDYAGFND